LEAAVADLKSGAMQWRVWGLLAFNDIRQRYRRSSLGQFWLTISMAAMIGGMGIVYAMIFQQPVADYLPFLGTGLIIWALLSGLVNDLATCFIHAHHYLQSYPTPRSTVIYRTIARNIIASTHNFLIIPFLLVLFHVPVSFVALLALPAIALIVLNGVWIGMLVGPLCARFRDLPQIIASVMQIVFFLTPVLYRPDQLGGRLWVLTHLNPFASFVEIVRAPLLNELPQARHYILALACTLTGWTIGLLFFARFRGRILYWL
jgi:ABC-type polysaccharide/polyol phosphate export permease